MKNNIPSWRRNRQYQQYSAWMANRILLMFVLIIAVNMFMSSGNPIIRYRVEKHAREYLQTNYPGVYERVQTQNSGNANYGFSDIKDERYWNVHFFEREQPNDMFSPQTNLTFDMRYDEKGNLTADGYKDYYLKGGSVYRDRSWKFYEDVADAVYIRKDDILQGVKLEYVWVDDSHFYLMDDEDTYYRISYSGPYYNPQEEYDYKELAAIHGRADVYMRVKEEITPEKYCSMAGSILHMLEDKDVRYHSVNIYLYAREGANNTYRTAVKYGDIDFADTLQAIKANTTINTERILVRF